MHGTPTWSYVWRRVVPGLSDRFAVYVFDLLGYGDSEPAGQDVSIAAQKRLLTELIGLWGLEAPAVAGHDIGGAIVLRTHLLNEVPFHPHRRGSSSSLDNADVQAHAGASGRLPHDADPYLRTGGGSPHRHRPMDEATFEQYFSRWRGKEEQEAYLQKVAQFDERYTAEFEHLLGSLRVPIRIIDRKSTRLKLQSRQYLVCRLLLEKKNYRAR